MENIKTDILTTLFHETKGSRCPRCGFVLSECNKDSAVYDGLNRVIDFGQKVIICSNCYYPMDPENLDLQAIELAKTTTLRSIKSSAINYLVYKSIVADGSIFLNVFQTFNTEVADSKQRKLLISFKNEAEQQAGVFSTEDQHRLFIVGTTGTGKTHLSMSIIDKVLAEREYKRNSRPYRATIVNWAEYVNLVRNSWSDRTLSNDLENRKRSIFKSDLILLDDLGVLTSSNNSAKDYEINLLMEFAEKTKGKNLICTTNATGKELIKIYGARVIGRLIDDSETIKTIGIETHRKIKALKA